MGEENGEESVSRVAGMYYIKSSIFNKKIMIHERKQESVTHTQEKSRQQKLPLRGPSYQTYQIKTSKLLYYIQGTKYSLKN